MNNILGIIKEKWNSFGKQTESTRGVLKELLQIIAKMMTVSKYVVLSFSENSRDND